MTKTLKPTRQPRAPKELPAVFRARVEPAMPAVGDPGPAILAEMLNEPIRKARAASGVKAGDGSVRVRKVAKPAAPVEKPPRAGRGRRVDQAIAKRVAKAAKPAEPVNGELADGLKAARKADAKTERGPTVKERIWALISRPEGATEREVCEALGGWKKAGATIGRAIKAADFGVRKEKDGGRTRYFRV